MINVIECTINELQRNFDNHNDNNNFIKNKVKNKIITKKIICFNYVTIYKLLMKNRCTTVGFDRFVALFSMRVEYYMLSHICRKKNENTFCLS